MRDVLNRIIWDPKERASEYEVTFIHRGLPGNVRTIRASDIKEVHGSWFLLKTLEQEPTVIPLHRVLEVRQTSSGICVWRRKLKG
ncbi:MAG: RNA repair domain-containing protein [Candidatus Bathyarchaeia archaeon]